MARGLSLSPAAGAMPAAESRSVFEAARDPVLLRGLTLVTGAATDAWDTEPAPGSHGAWGPAGTARRGGGSGQAHVQQRQGTEKELCVGPDTAWVADLELGRGSCPVGGSSVSPQGPSTAIELFERLQRPRRRRSPQRSLRSCLCRARPSSRAPRSCRQRGEGPRRPRGAGAGMLLDMQAGVQQPRGAGERAEQPAGAGSRAGGSPRGAAQLLGAPLPTCCWDLALRPCMSSLKMSLGGSEWCMQRWHCLLG